MLLKHSTSYFSSERSPETPSTLSSVCSRTRLEVNKVVQPVLPDESVRERDSRIETDDQPLFEMMENVYMAVSRKYNMC